MTHEQLAHYEHVRAEQIAAGESDDCRKDTHPLATYKSWESAWMLGHITCAEYHSLLDYSLRRLYEQEMYGY